MLRTLQSLAAADVAGAEEIANLQNVPAAGGVFDVCLTHPRVLSAVKHVLGERVATLGIREAPPPSPPAPDPHRPHPTRADSADMGRHGATVLPADARALAPSVEVDKSYREALHTDYSGHLHPDGTMHLSPEGLVVDSATAAPRGRPFHTCNTHWMLTDFTETNGATRCVPGTHMCGAYPHSIMNEDTRRERFPSEQVITGQVSNRRVSDPLSFEQRASSAAAVRTGRQRHRLERPHLALGHAQHLAGREALVTHQLLRHARVGGPIGTEVSGR